MATLSMPEGSCFLTSLGNHGLIGRHLKIDTLKYAGKEEINDMIESHLEG